MPKEAFGGDEGGGGNEDKKKPGLSKFGLTPDVNIRDVFWKIMDSYAATKKPGLELSSLEHDRFALMRVALSVLSSQHGEYYGIAPKFVVTYTIMMMIDAGWKDAFIEFLEKAHESRGNVVDSISLSLKDLLMQEEYKKILMEHFSGMVRSRHTNTVALAYIAQINNVELAASMKKELIILARGDIGQNQLNAIKIISEMKTDEEVKKSLIILLSHWDAEARLAAANALNEVSGDNEVRNAAKKRFEMETDPEVKKILGMIAK